MAEAGNSSRIASLHRTRESTIQQEPDLKFSPWTVAIFVIIVGWRFSAFSFDDLVFGFQFEVDPVLLPNLTSTLNSGLLAALTLYRAGTFLEHPDSATEL